MQIKFYKPDGSFSYAKDSKDIDPYTRMLKTHFFFGGTAVIDGQQDRITDHNTLSQLINL